MRNRLFLLCVSTLSVIFGSTTTATAAALGIRADLNNFLQSGVITNTSDADLNIVEIVYSLGAAEENLATWDGSFGTGGGVASDFLADPNFFQTLIFSNLSIAPTQNFSFSGIDIDLIQSLDPLVAIGDVLGGPETLRNAFIAARFDNGEMAIMSLQRSAWDSPQQLQFGSSFAQAPTAVPTPALLPSILGMGFALKQRRKRTPKS